MRPNYSDRYDRDMLTRIVVLVVSVFALTSACSGSSDASGESAPKAAKTAQSAAPQPKKSPAGPVTFDDPRVAKLISSRFGDCLKDLHADAPQYSSKNVWTTSSDKGRLSWRAAYGNTGKLLTLPTVATDQILDESGCYN